VSQFRATSGGYYTTSGSRSWLFTRIHAHRDRPNQADMLHVDLWYDGINVLRDGGSFHYHCDQPWQHFFESTAAHNTVEVDGQDQMERGPSFLWFRWTQARLLDYAVSEDGRVSYIAGEHDGYRRLPGRVVHARAICRVLDTYAIIDDLAGSGSHELALRWRLHPGLWQENQGVWQTEVSGRAIQLSVRAPAGFATQLLRGQEAPQPEGWESIYYSEKQPVSTLVTRGTAALPVRLTTLIGPADAGIRIVADSAAGGGTALELAGVDDPDLAAEVVRLSRGAIECQPKPST
jgi:asparagine synthase (glutamine-hydrolysing)